MERPVDFEYHPRSYNVPEWYRTKDPLIVLLPVVYLHAMEDIQKSITRFISCCEGLLKGELTPLLRSEIEKAYNNHLSVRQLSLAEITHHVHDLKSQQKSIENHWNQIFQNMITKAYIFLELEFFEHFLSDKLCEDYINEPLYIAERILDFARIKGSSDDRKLAAHKLTKGREEELDNLYQKIVVFAVKELTLDLAHVERKLSAALERNGKPGSDIQALIDQCRWADLATVLVEDQKLSLKVNPGSYQTFTKFMIKHGIDQVRRTYFKELISPSAFTLSTHARALSPKSVPSDENQQPMLTKAVSHGISTKIYGIWQSMTGPRDEQSDIYRGRSLELKKSA